MTGGRAPDAGEGSGGPDTCGRIPPGPRDAGGPRKTDGINRERVTALRGRIRERVYDRHEVAERVARRMLERRDVSPGADRG